MYNCAAAAKAKSHQSCLTLCDSIDGNPPGSPVPGVLQARIILEWVAISFSNITMNRLHCEHLFSMDQMDTTLYMSPLSVMHIMKTFS